MRLYPMPDGSWLDPHKVICVRYAGSGAEFISIEFAGIGTETFRACGCSPTTWAEIINAAMSGEALR